MSTGDEKSSRDDIAVLPFDGPASEWDRIVAELSGSTFCHLYGWRSVMSEVFGHEGPYWLAVDAERRPVGILPLIRVRSRLFGDYLLSMPFLSYGGPLGTERARHALATRAIEEADRLDVDLLELRSREEVPGGLQTSDRKVTVLLDLPDDPELLWKDGLKSKVRSQVRRPRKEGMTAQVSRGLVDEFYGVFSRTMRDLGTPVLPKRFFEAVAQTFEEQVLFGTVEHQGRIVAAGCGFLWKGEFEITWAGALREFSRLAPNMLLYWSLMEASIERNATVFNFGRCTPDSGTHRFKRQWGGEDHPLPWAQWSPSGIEATPNPESPRYRLAIDVWRRLPLGITNRLGPLLARSLP